MKRAMLLVLVLVAVVGVMVAQDEEPDYTVAVCDEAQGWYDEAGEIAQRALEQATSLVDSADFNEYREKRDEFEIIIEELETLPPVECTVYAHEQWVAGFELLLNSLEAFATGDTQTYVDDMQAAMYALGQAHGYLVALGVDVEAEE